jgi:uncharacterized membrane protein
MNPDHVEQALESDAPLSTAKHQHDVAHAAAEARSWDDAALAARNVTINLPRNEVFAFWRDFTNFPAFMDNILAVERIDDRTSHWVVAAPGGKTVEWDSLITEEIPNELIVWESAPDADIKNTGRIEFHDGPPGRGTEVSATIVYDPPGGDIGKLIAKLFQKEPKVQARQDLRRLKQLLETGEVSVSDAPDAAPRGH